MRAILLASAMAAILVGRRANNAVSHGQGEEDQQLARGPPFRDRLRQASARDRVDMILFQLADPLNRIYEGRRSAANGTHGGYEMS